jgi:hypothetical protein
MKHILSGLLSSVFVLMTGCGGSGGVKVSGTVTFNNEPIKEGYIAFLPVEEGGTGSGGPIADGQYSVRVPAGKNRVQITATTRMALPPGEVSMYGETEETRQYLPARYNAKTELEAEVSRSSSPLNFELMPE